MLPSLSDASTISSSKINDFYRYEYTDHLPVFGYNDPNFWERLMRRRLWIVSLVMLLALVGCSSDGPDAGLLSYTSKIPTEKVNETLLKVTPIKRRSTFGSLVLQRAEIHPAAQGDRVALVTRFTLTTFEIPEGVDGSLAASCGLRYDKETRQIFLTDIRPGIIKFANASLAEYVGKGTRKAIGSIVSHLFSDIPIYQMDSSFAAKFVKKVAVHKGNIVVVHGL
jgi:hypothetical protein